MKITQRPTPITTTPFFAAANAVLRAYRTRQERSVPKTQANSTAEIYWGSERLNDIAMAAAYAGSKEAPIIRATVELWLSTAETPDYFPGSGVQNVSINRVNIYPQ